MDTALCRSLKGGYLLLSGESVNHSVWAKPTCKTISFDFTVVLLRIAAIATLLAVVCGPAAAVQPNPTSKACVTNVADIAGLSGDASTDVHAVQNFIHTTGYMLEQHKFDELECLADSFRASKETFPGGLSKLHNLYGGLAMPPRHSDGRGLESPLGDSP